MLSTQLGVGYSHAFTRHPIVICLLGGFRLFKGKQPVSLRHGGKSVELLELLALRSTLGLEREALLAAVWPESDLPLAAQSLNNVVYTLHKLLGDEIGDAMPVCRVDGQYRLNLEAGLGVDVIDFDALADAGDQAHSANNAPGAAQAYAQAAALYHGDLCVENDLYAVVERERLRARYLTLLVRLADYEYERAEIPACLAHAQRLVQHDPCREDAHRLIMRCCVRLGMRAQALRQFSLCARLLQSEFDARPEPETVELYDRIRLEPASL